MFGWGLVGKMEEGRLQVLVLNAKGIRRSAPFIGKSAFYVVIQCGDQLGTTKTSVGHHHEAFWNDKLEFDLPLSEWKKLTSLKMSIMDEEYFHNQGFIGQSLIEIGGIISEGEEKGSIEVLPSSYNVILKDHSYKGQIKLAFKFTLTKNANANANGDKTKTKTDHENAGKVEEEQQQQSVYASFLRFLRLPSWWNWRFTILHGQP